MRSTTRKSAFAAAAIVALMALTGCGGDDDKAPGGADQDISSASDDLEVIEECVTAFPGSFGKPDIANLDRVPADWPEPPVDDAVLCGPAATMDAVQVEADYATSAPPEEVLDAYTQALKSAGFEVETEDPSGLGRTMISGRTDEVFYQVIAKDGGFTVAFAGETDGQ